VCQLLDGGGKFLQVQAMGLRLSFQFIAATFGQMLPPNGPEIQ
jgi:hypothetical protein